MKEAFKNLDILQLQIIEKQKDFFKIKVSKDHQTTLIAFSPTTKALVFLKDNELSNFLKKNEYQIRKMLHNKKKETYFVGFTLNFVIKDEKQVKHFNDLKKVIILDRRNGQYLTYPSDKGKEKIFKIYTDGSYHSQKNIGSYVAILKNENGLLDIVYGYTEEKLSSTLLELLAAIKGLEKIKNKNQIRIITDSRYVIKGLTEWIINWKLNDWHTVQGKRVKNIEYWQKFDKLTEGKYIEFQWIKGHSTHFENNLCDKYAKEIIEKYKKRERA